MEVMEKNLSKWQSITELKSKYDQFVRNIKKIEDYIKILQTEPAPLKQTKNDANKALVEHVFPVTSVLGVYACDRGDKKLCRMASIKFTELEKFKHGDLVKFSRKILKITGKLLDQQTEEGKKPPKHLLADYGLTAQHLDKVKVALDTCIKDEVVYREVRSTKKQSQVKLDQRIRDNNQIMKKKLDRIMHLFRDTQKTFYNAYIKARIPVESTEKPAAKPAAAAKKTGATAEKPLTTAARKPATGTRKPSSRKPPATEKGSA